MTCWSIARRSKGWLESLAIILMGTMFGLCIIAAAWTFKLLIDDQKKTTFTFEPANDTQVEPTQLTRPNQTWSTTAAPNLRQKRSWGTDISLELDNISLNLQNVSIKYTSLERKKRSLLEHCGPEEFRMKQRMRKRCVIKFKSLGIDNVAPCNVHYCILDLKNSGIGLECPAITTTLTMFFISMSTSSIHLKIFSGLYGMIQGVHGETVEEYQKRLLNEKVNTLEAKLENALELIEKNQNQELVQTGENKTERNTTMTKNTTKKEKKEKTSKPVDMYEVSMIVALCLLTGCFVTLMALATIGGIICSRMDSDQNNNRRQDLELWNFNPRMNQYHRMQHQDSPPIQRQRMQHQDSPPIQRPATLNLNRGETGTRRREKVGPGAHPLLIGGKSPEGGRRFTTSGATAARATTDGAGATGTGAGTSADPVNLM